MDLFEGSTKGSHEPLAARMRPRNLDEYIGQDHIIGPGRLLRRAIQADQLTSVIFYGPPGTGKTTLARVIANHTSSNFVTLNAVLAGVQQIRESIAQADDQRKLYNRKTILFVDEVHRWNRAQQDALLPWVENGTIILIGATTENPFFEVNKALVSRSRVFQLTALTADDLRKATINALTDRERGYGKWRVEFAEGALEHLIDTASGDARSLLNALELAVETSVPAWPPEEGTRIAIDLETAEESIQRKLVLYDKSGDYHYDIISAYIKSLRGRDPDAALYWLARMLAAGEDPHFIFRRLLISACEDTGLADPQAICVVESCASAFDRLGLPEGRFHLTHATLYLATAPKSNSAMAMFDALESVEKESGDVPNHLRDASRDAEGFGHGEGYQYPHAWRDHWVAQQYLPSELVGRIFYTPSTQGYEGQLRDEILNRRELQVAAILSQWEPTASDRSGGQTGAGGGAYDRFYFGMEGTQPGPRKPAANGEILTFSPGGSRREEWTRRTECTLPATLLAIRNGLMDRAELHRHHRVLIERADDGLLLWEAGRRVPEGFCAGFCRTAQACATLERYAQTLETMDRPTVRLHDPSAERTDNPFGVPFDRVLAREPAATESGLVAFARDMLPLCADDGRIAFCARVPARGMRLWRLLPEDDAFRPDLREAEDRFYADASNPLFAWTEESLARAIIEALAKEGSAVTVKTATETVREERLVEMRDLERWFAPESAWGAAIADGLGPVRARALRDKLEHIAAGRPMPWEYEMLYVTVRKATAATPRAR